GAGARGRGEVHNPTPPHQTTAAGGGGGRGRVLSHTRRYVATPLRSPDFVLLAQAHGLAAFRVTRREEIPEAVARARAEPGSVVVEFRVEQEESVYPMVPANTDLDKMIRRPAFEEDEDDP